VGDALDMIGQYTYRAFTLTALDARAKGAIPCGLLEGAIVTAPIKRGELITHANTRVDATSKIVAMRAKQDEMVYGAAR
jgi:predicted homoserine dehydrogenase-like protein